MAADRWDPSFKRALLEAPDYRSLLALFFERAGKWSRPKPMSYSAFARRSGFASKSFIHDVIGAKKRLTARSLPKVVSGLKLSARWEDYFAALVAVAEPEFRNESKSEVFYENRVREIKKTLRPKKTRTLSPVDPRLKILLEENFPEIYASLGTYSAGASFPEIVTRSRCDEENVRTVLSRLETTGLVEARSGRYFPVDDEITAIALSGVPFREDFQRALRKTRARIDRQISSPRSYFAVQTFSVKSADLAKLRADFAALIESFAASAEDADGDLVGEICVSFTHAD